MNGIRAVAADPFESLMSGEGSFKRLTNLRCESMGYAAEVIFL